MVIGPFHQVAVILDQKPRRSVLLLMMVHLRGMNHPFPQSDFRLFVDKSHFRLNMWLDIPSFRHPPRERKHDGDR